MKFLVNKLPDNYENCPLHRMVQSVGCRRISKSEVSPNGVSITFMVDNKDNAEYIPFCKVSQQRCNIGDCDKNSCDGMIVIEPMGGLQ